MLRMMIADDERVIRETIKNIIDWKALDIEIVGTCKDGIEAYNMILDEYPDIVLTDIKMPGFTGLELIEHIRQLDESIEFIILTGFEEFSFARQAMRFGVRHYLLKPCNEKQIVEAVNDVKKEINRKTAEMTSESEEIRRLYDSKDFKSELVLQLEKSLTELSELVKKSVDDGYVNMDFERRKKIFTAIEKSIQPLDDKEFIVFLISGLLVKYADTNRVYFSPMQIMDYVMQIKKMDNLQEIKDSFLQTLNFIFPENFAGNRTVADFINKTISYVEQHLSDSNLSLKWLAEHYLFMNVDYLSKQFVKQTGYRFSDFLNRKRVERAKQLLTESADVQIPDVAEKIGFGNNPQYFYLIFKKYTGITPAVYINSWKNGGI